MYVMRLEINDRRPKGYRTRLIDLLCSPHRMFTSVGDPNIY